MERRASIDGSESSLLPSRRQFLYTTGAVIAGGAIYKGVRFGINMLRGPGKIQVANELGVYSFDPVPAEEYTTDIPPSADPEMIPPTQPPPKEKTKEMKSGAQLIERDIAIRVRNGHEVIARIIQTEQGIGLRIGDMKYAIINKVFESLVTSWITSVTYHKTADKIRFESHRRIPPVNMSGIAFVARKECEAILAKLAMERPDSALYNLECEYHSSDLERSGKEVVGVQFERVIEKKVSTTSPIP